MKPAIKCSTLPRMSSQDSLRANNGEALRPLKPASTPTPPPTTTTTTTTTSTTSLKPLPPPKPPNLMLTRPSLSLQNSTDLRLSPEVYNQLRVLQKKAKELRTDVRNLRKTSQANALTMKELLRDTISKITSVLQSNEESLLQGTSDAERARIQREEASYRQDMNKLDKDLCDLELKVEELRNNVINRRLRVNMSDVENMALILSRSSKTVADLKAKFPILQDGLKDLISAEMERAICNEKFLKEEPDKLESALRRCKKLTGTLVTLKRLASVQEQRVPPLGPGGVPVGVANGDPRATSPTPTEDLRASSSKQPGVVPSPHLAHPGATDGQPRLRAENALDALLDELQTFAQPPSEAGSRKSSLEPPPTPQSTTAPATLTASTTVKRLPSFPSSDSQSSPVKTPASALYPGAASTLPRAASSNPALPPREGPGQKLGLAQVLQGMGQPGDPHRLPPPPPPRTSSRSPMLSPTSPLAPAGRAVSLPPGGPVVSKVGEVLRNAEGRELYGPVLRQRPPLGRGSFSEDSTASSASTNSSTSSAKAGQLSSNSSSTESVNSQEGAAPHRPLGTGGPPPTPPPKQRQENLEARHMELLRRQRQLQEQYQRLQSLQRSGGRPTPANIDLKKTGSESNLTARLGLSLAPAPPHGSLSNLSSPSTHTNTLPNPKTSSAALSAGNGGPTSRRPAGLVETDIL
ncbi:coiled-coil domain-containing protein AGAP005037-like isoform X3 [Scylla paramamosain]|uniref:coiled-coil domain-containing protein AGAP005037-like isoform X3 n=1 Tax=Scylla paramamosain TaxID=85552 RepID=UPI0030836DDB